MNITIRSFNKDNKINKKLKIKKFVMFNSYNLKKTSIKKSFQTKFQKFLFRRTIMFNS